jgi:hypothetical protein
MTNAAAAGGAGSYWPLLVFGVLAMALLAALQWVRFQKGGKFSASFMKSYGLIMVATLGCVLIFADATSEAKTGAFTLLGTIAGYLATAKPADPVEPGVDAGGGGEGLA